MWLLEGGRLLCPATGLDERLDLRVDGERIVEIGRGLRAGDARVIDCAGAVIVPGFIDLSSELCDPGLTWREDLQSGSRAAAAGGFSVVVASPATEPVVDTSPVAADVLARAARLDGATVLQSGALTVGLQGKELAELNDLVDAGCVALSDGGHAISDSLVLRNVLDYARPLGVPILLRPGEPALEERGCMHEGEVSTRIGLHGISAAAEEIGAARAIALCRLTGVRLHLTHVTTARCVALLAAAKAEGLPVTGAVPARHLLLTDEALDQRFYDPNLRVLPPLRPAADRDALRAAVREGVVDVIAADHVPWTRVEKEHEITVASAGALGLESAFSAALTALDDLASVVRGLSLGPGRVLGWEPALRVGARADLAVLDPAARQPHPGPRFSRGCNEPLAGVELSGRVRATFARGRLAWAESTLVIR